MEHAVAPEMDLLHLTEEGMYEKLQRLLDRHQNGADGRDGGCSGLTPVIFAMNEYYAAPG